MKASNTALKNALLTRQGELQAQWVVGDKAVTWQLVDEFAASFPGSKTKSAIYQMIRYHLRSANDSGYDRRKTYTKLELQNLMLMTAEDRLAYASDTGRSIRAVNAALERYRSKILQDNPTQIALGVSQSTMDTKGYFNFSSPSDLHLIGLSRSDILSVRQLLMDKYGLALRAPNILYHPATKRRYAMTTAEQSSLLSDPIKFLRVRSAHIKDRWVTKACDPIDDADIQNEVGNRATWYNPVGVEHPILPNGAIDVTKQATKTVRTGNMLETLCATMRTMDHVDPKNYLYDHMIELSRLIQELTRPEQEGE